MRSGNLNFLEPSGPLQVCNGTALPYIYIYIYIYIHTYIHTYVHTHTHTDSALSPVCLSVHSPYRKIFVVEQQTRILAVHFILYFMGLEVIKES